jgi:hypothetical protein
VLRVDRVLLWLRVSGRRPEPVRVEPVPVRVLEVAVGAEAAGFAGSTAFAASAIPHTLQ